ncbi:MAG: hypothetical protein R2771_02655 [Saprospiraceae bacterium]
MMNAGIISAQSNPDRDIETQYRDAFSTLDMSELNTGILYDMVPEYVPLYVLNGQALPDSIAMDGKSFTLAYGMINYAHLDRSIMPPNDSFINMVNRWQDFDEVILGALYFRYDKFRDDIIERNLIVADTVNKTITRGSNRGISPYKEDTLFSFTCMKNNSNSLHQVFKLSEEAFYTNIPSGFQSTEIDFGDGNGYVPVSVGNNIVVDYRTYGKYYIKMRLQLESGKYLYAHSFINIEEKVSNIVNRDYNAPVLVHTNDNVEVWAFINDNCGNDKIKKPLILIDGFDVNDDYDEEQINTILKEANSSQSLTEILNPDDYDIFFFNLIDPTIDIFDNGAYVREAIEWVNEQKALAGSNEKDVVVGFSMGGLLGKIALRTMELDGVDHETEMYFTYDSPLKGANIPMAMQCLLDHIANYHMLEVPIYDWSEAIKKNVDNLNSPAARQMLYYHYSNANWVTENPITDSKYTEASALKVTHDQFYQQFESLGQLNIPQIAISNGGIIDGDESTVGQGFLPDEVILDHFMLWDDVINGTNFWEDLGTYIIDVLGFTSGIYFVADFKGNSLPRGDGTVYSGYLTIHFLHIGGIGDMDIRKVKNAKPYDSCPGGSRPLNFDKVPLQWSATAHCFIPTISSLGIDDINNNIDPYYYGDFENPSNVLPNTYCAAYIGSNSIKSTYEDFPNYSNINEKHIFVSEDAKGFIKSYLTSTDYLFDGISGLGNVLENRTYNFGSPEVDGYLGAFKMSNIIDFDLDINNNGKLWINREGKLAFSDLPPNRVNTNPHEYRTIIRGQNVKHFLYM